MTVLVATDFSPAAREACDLAGRLARTLGESVVALHVLDTAAVRAPHAGEDYAHLLSEHGAHAERLLEDAAFGIERFGVDAVPRLVSGSPEERIQAEAERAGASLVVVGGSRTDPAGRALHGSMAERLARALRPPVLAARHSEAFLGALNGGYHARLMVALDRSPASDAPIAWVRMLRCCVPCDVLFVHYYWPPAEYARLGVPGAPSFFRPHPEVAATLCRELEQRVGALPGEGECTIDVAPAVGSLGARIADEAGRHDAHLVVLGTHQRRAAERLIHGSVSLHVLRQVLRPVLCVPASYGRPRAPLPGLGRVLVATDLSEAGNRAVPFAYGLLRDAGGVVEVVYVATGLSKESSSREELLARLRALVPEDAPLHGVETAVHVIEEGLVAQAIAHLASKLGAQAICLSPHGFGGAHGAPLGPIASDLLRVADRPVLVVRSPP